MNLIVKAIKNPKKAFKVAKLLLLDSKLGVFISDKAYLKAVYKLNFGKPLNIENPTTYNEKLQWLKLYDRKPEYTQMVDKYAVKKFVSDRIGDEYLIHTLGVWDRFDDIDFDAFPDRFVLKCTHDSGGLIICRDKNAFDKKAAKKKIEKTLKRNYFWHGREWPYKNVQPRIIAEEYMEQKGSQCLPVYKFMTFGGRVELIQTIQNDKTKDETIDYFDRDWNLQDLRQNFPNSEKPLPRPENLSKMIEFAEMFAEGFKFLRVDFYEINGQIYFSEFTFYSDSGMAAFSPENWDYKLGNMIKI
ncbi:MAG: glycosyl transferase [Ruminococcaceae bacterium]|nr:glycosyl transferase [Oscillospiraceae bacterium]